MVELEDRPELKSQRIAEIDSVPVRRGVLATIGYVLKNCLLAVLFIAVTWAVVEYIFSAAHVGEDTVAQPNPLLGYSHLENQQITFRSEGYSRSGINEIGFRDRLYAVPKPAGVKRICITGDSMTMGLEVPLEATYPKQLEKRLQSEGKNIEVLNCGMSGTGTGQQYLGWRKTMASLQPDMLIIGYHLGDTDDNVGGGTNPPRPTFMLDTNKTLRIDFKDVDTWFAGENSRFYSSFGWFRRNSRVLAVLSKADLDLHADPAYKLVSKLIGKPVAAIWTSFLKKLPKGDWHIAETRSTVSDLMPQQQLNDSKPATSAPVESLEKVVSATPQATKPKQTPTTSAQEVQVATSSIQAPSLVGNVPAQVNSAKDAQPENKQTPAVPTPLPVQAEHGQQDIDLYRGMLWMHSNRVEVTKEILRRLNRECQAQNCQLVVAALPAYNNTIIYYRELEELRKLAEQEHFKYLNCWTAYPPRGPLDESPFHFTTHFNCAGHKLLSDTLYNSLFAGNHSPW